MEETMARSYRELLVWQKAKALAVHTYKATADFPRTETYGLTSQIRRASISVVSNIAEGQGRLTAGEFRHFLGQARGSLLEAETQLSIALDLGFVGKEAHDVLERESYQVLGLLDRLINALRPKLPAPR
jgi:four helix bundle protein